MRSPSAILIIGVSVSAKRVPVYIYKAPPTHPPTSSPTKGKSPTSSPSYQASSRPSLQPSFQPSLRPSLESSSQPSGNSVISSQSYQESAAAKPSSFGFWLIISIVASLLCLVLRCESKLRNSSSAAESSITPVGNVSPEVSSTSTTSGGKGNAVTETLGQAFNELSDLAEKTIFPLAVDDRTKKKFTKKTQSTWLWASVETEVRRRRIKFWDLWNKSGNKNKRKGFDNPMMIWL